MHSPCTPQVRGCTKSTAKGRHRQRPGALYVSAPRTGAVVTCFVGIGLRSSVAVELLAGDAAVDR